MQGPHDTSDPPAMDNCTTPASASAFTHRHVKGALELRLLPSLLVVPELGCSGQGGWAGRGEQSSALRQSVASDIRPRGSTRSMSTERRLAEGLGTNHRTGLPHAPRRQSS